MRSVRARGAALFALVAAGVASVAAGQDGVGPIATPRSFDDRLLVERYRVQEAAAHDAEERLRGRLDALAEAYRVLDELAPADGASIASALAPEHLATAWDGVATAVEGAAATIGALDLALKKLEGLHRELEARVRAGAVAPEHLGAGRARAPSDRRRALAPLLARVGDDAAALSSDRARVDAALETARVRLAAAEGLAELDARASERDDRRASIDSEVAAKDPGAVAGILVALASERERRRAALELERVRLDGALAEVARLASSVAVVALPEPGALGVESRTGKARAAELALRLAEAGAAAADRRTLALATLSAALRRVTDGAIAVARDAERLGDDLAREEAAARVVRDHVARGTLVLERPLAAIDTSALAAVGSSLASASTRARAALGDAGERARRIERELVRALVDARSERANRRDLRSAFEAERERAKWTARLEGLRPDELSAQLRAAHDGWREAEARVAALRSDVVLETAAYEAAELRAGGLDDPFARRARPQLAGERREIAEALRRTLGLPPLADAPAPPPAAAPVAAPAPPSLADETEARERALSGQLQAVEQRIRLAAARVEAARRLVAKRSELASAAESALELFGRAYGAALELEARKGTGAIGALPLEAEELRSLSATSVERRVTDARERRSDAVKWLHAAQAAAHELALERDELEAILRLLGNEADALRVAARIPVGSGPGGEGSSEAERRRLEQETLRRSSEEDSLPDALLDVFRSELAESLAALLRAHYHDLIGVERRATVLAERRGLLERAARSVDEERRAVERLVPHARRALERARGRFEAARVTAGLVAPDDERAVAAIRSAGLSVPRVKPPSVATLGVAVDSVFDAKVRLAGAEQRLAELERSLGREGLEAFAGRCDDELAATRAALDATERQRLRLVGRPRAALEALAAADRPASAADVDRFLLGEIGHVRAVRRSVLVRAAVRASLSLVAIPLLALVLLRLARRVGASVVRRVRDAGPAEGAVEREQRAETLVQVFRAAWTVVVVAVASVYVLRQLSVDVTPILASAGVAGLAIAFGAQQLVRDYFAGFFMLLENQYKIGDVIRIGDASGVVEQITLRLTVLRSLDGTVHFIPNGTVLQVANLTKEWSRAVVPVSVAYDVDLDRVLQVLRGTCQALRDDPAFRVRIVDRPEIQAVENFGESALDLRLLVKTRPGDQWDVARELRLRVKTAFDAAGMTIALPQRVVRHVNPPPKG